MGRSERSEGIPRVFISSTVKDLKRYREAADFAAHRAGFHVLAQEYFVASGDKRPLERCLEEVSKADVLVTIVAHYYGWVPADQPDGDTKSVTWLECKRAANEGKVVLAFLVDDEANWPLDLREEYRLAAAAKEGGVPPQLVAEVTRNIAKLKEFKQWLSAIGIRSAFTDPIGLQGQVEPALLHWRSERRGLAALASPPGDPRKYLESLRESTATVDLRGLLARTGKPLPPPPIEHIYVPLATTSTTKAPVERYARRASRSGKARELPEADLMNALAHSRLVILGYPGSGKSTFLKRVAFELCQALLEEAGLAFSPAATTDAAGARFRQKLAAAVRPILPKGKLKAATTAGSRAQWPFPVLVPVRDFADHIRKNLKGPEGPATAESPEWLIHFLETQNKEQSWLLGEAFFRRQLEDGLTILLLDGLDEAPTAEQRESMARLFEGVTRAYGRCRFVVTTRPQGYAGKATLERFQVAEVAPLDRNAIEQFLTFWCTLLYPGTSAERHRHQTELGQALRGSGEIRLMASNPMMLTALAVVHWNEGRLPEQRWELYASTLKWLAESRKKNPGREKAERCLALFGQLALVMQNDREGRLVSVSKVWAQDALAPQFTEIPRAQRRSKALEFLEQEEVDSGIIVSDGAEITFWHDTFREYLAAKAISGLEDREQYDLLLKENRIYRPEWREVARLLTGVLMAQGKAKVDGLVKALLDQLKNNAALAQQARCVGLIGAMIQDVRSRGYEPSEPRYKDALEAVLGIFDPAKASGVDFQVRLEAAEALGQAGDPRLHQHNWITVPAGDFLMGAQREDADKPNYDSEAYENESPVHQVYLDAYQIGRYAVTAEEYSKFVDDQGYGSERWWVAGGFERKRGPEGWDEQVQHPNWPVVNVSWYEAEAYCAWAGVRLPTEAEWERAARGAGATGRKYPWGNDRPDIDRINAGRAGIGHPTPVGLYPRGATPEGAEDLTGNVCEWVADRYEKDYYTRSPYKHPTGPQSGELRVLRGGSWSNYFGTDLRAASRLRYQPGDRGGHIGFRCVRKCPR